VCVPTRVTSSWVYRRCRRPYINRLISLLICPSLGRLVVAPAPPLSLRCCGRVLSEDSTDDNLEVRGSGWVKIDSGHKNTQKLRSATLRERVPGGFPFCGPTSVCGSGYYCVSLCRARFVVLFFTVRQTVSLELTAVWGFGTVVCPLGVLKTVDLVLESTGDPTSRWSPRDSRTKWYPVTRPTDSGGVPASCEE